MDHLMATFTFGDGESWDIPLPICIRCEQDRAVAAIQKRVAQECPE